MSSRAERRRELRAAGQRRAPDKGGRRPAIRAAVATQGGESPYDVAQRLMQEGFELATPKLWRPTDEGEGGA